MNISGIVYVAKVISHLISNEGYTPDEACERVKNQAMAVKILHNAKCSTEGVASRLRLSDWNRTVAAKMIKENSDASTT